MKYYIPTLTIAGSDSSGGAGIQADLKAMSALGCYAMSVITATTAQNTTGVTDVFPITPEHVEAQLKAVIQDIRPLAIKTGMLFSSEVIETVALVLREQKPEIPLVVDPVMVATSGDRLLKESAISSYISDLIPLACLITPNLPEAEVLSGVKITSEESMDLAAQKILHNGARAVLIKGGHANSNEATDILYTQNGDREVFTSERIETKNTHGTGCTLSAAITAYLAQGQTLAQSIQSGKEYLTYALRSGKNIEIGHGHGPVDHFYNPHKSIKR